MVSILCFEIKNAFLPMFTQTATFDTRLDQVILYLHVCQNPNMDDLWSEALREVMSEEDGREVNQTGHHLLTAEWLLVNSALVKTWSPY